MLAGQLQVFFILYMLVNLATISITDFVINVRILSHCYILLSQSKYNIIYTAPFFSSSSVNGRPMKLANHVGLWKPLAVLQKMEQKVHQCLSLINSINLYSSLASNPNYLNRSCDSLSLVVLIVISSLSYLCKKFIHVNCLYGLFIVNIISKKKSISCSFSDILCKLGCFKQII